MNVKKMMKKHKKLIKKLDDEIFVKCLHNLYEENMQFRQELSKKILEDMLKKYEYNKCN